MFRAMISPIFRGTRLCVTACGIMHPRCWRPVAWMRWNVISSASSLVLLKIGEIIARNMLSWLELLINRYFCIYLVVCVTYINDARSNKYQMKIITCNVTLCSIVDKYWRFGEIWCLHLTGYLFDIDMATADYSETFLKELYGVTSQIAWMLPTTVARSEIGREEIRRKCYCFFFLTEEIFFKPD